MMCLRRRVGVGSFFVFTTLLLTSCGGRERPIVRGKLPATQKLLVAKKTDLVRSIAEFYDSIQSFSTTVNLTASLGSVYKGKITDYTEISGYIDFRKPSEIRVVGLAPLIHSTAFAMVSDGHHFKVSLPISSKFIEGENNAPANSTKTLENLRPESFLNAILVRPVDLEHELTTMIDDTTETFAYYQLAIIKKLPDGDIAVIRRITFDRTNLLVVEQREYDDEGSIIASTKYGNWQIYSGIRFPAHIAMTRPKDGYGVELGITKLDLNTPIPDARFLLARPEGTELQVIGSNPEKIAPEPHSTSGKAQK